VRSYLTLLRLPYQWQLGPIFGWGFLLGGGTWNQWPDVALFLWVFCAFHVGGFGGLTALNSFYDRDDGPIGGLWQPPPPPPLLWHFAWCVQALGLLMLLPVSLVLSALYVMILALALGYSHPRTRWKGRPWLSVLVVGIGQGTFDFLAGATLAGNISGISLWCAALGATLIVCGFFPLTQLFQLTDDAHRGDYTTAAALQRRFGRRGVFVWAQGCFLLGSTLNACAVLQRTSWREALIVWCGSCIWLVLIASWRRKIPAGSVSRSDWQHMNRLLRAASASFGAYVVWRLCIGGYS
jgi:1,4-dihydroxy-2-naphthoate octaprenyltransferase